MFCAIATTIERCKAEGVVDVFQVVKALRMQKPGAVRTVVRLINLILYTLQLIYTLQLLYTQRFTYSLRSIG